MGRVLLHLLQAAASEKEEGYVSDAIRAGLYSGVALFNLFVAAKQMLKPEGSRSTFWMLNLIIACALFGMALSYALTYLKGKS